MEKLRFEVILAVQRAAESAEISKERQRLGMPPVEPTIGGGGGSGSVDTGKRKRKDGEQRKLTPEEQYQVRRRRRRRW